MKFLKKAGMLTFVSILLLVILSVPVYAKKKTPTKDDAKNGVVQINTVFVDENTGKHVVCGGAGFIVGSEEGTEYVITCSHIVNPSEEAKNAAFEFYEIPNNDEAWSKINLSTEIVMEGDIVVQAEQVNSSPEYDLSILKLSQPIHTRTPLTVLTNKDYDLTKLPYETTEKVYALGYPDRIGYDSAVQYFTNEQIVMTAGSIANLLSFNGIQTIESDVAVGENNCGGPLVNEYGYVIGMNTLSKDGMYSCALDSTVIAKVLDGFGFEYSKVYSNPKQKEAEKKPASEESDKAKDSSIPLWLLIIICVGIVSVVSGIVTIIIVKITRKNDKKEAKKGKDDVPKNEALARYSSQDNLDVIRSLGSINSQAPGTSVLSGGLNSLGETTVLDGEKVDSQKLKLGTLVRVKTGEKISISKGMFSIGKDNLHVDYCIKDNGTISRKHAVIRQAKEGLYLEDANSTNGSWLNGRKLVFGRAELLRNGDMIKLSNEEFEYRA
ncbi:FHA domain-containing protein [Pseudobutyrivibrio sp. YE44]|uniref:trypsin-like peptidase domain-containing protein n=1 Tax=Pseudobutyrivibrio sp. YE44 TaxID=1520802 RepID=UPI0008848293|nr:trypsin-like peptidase domain-containing protein [Pseudobutyrivibrio sp. YE44]SDB51852.1 FHA domain-containing protein [Pseudobutyrivibrio sp. YE44]